MLFSSLSLFQNDIFSKYKTTILKFEGSNNNVILMPPPLSPLLLMLNLARVKTFSTILSFLSAICIGAFLSESERSTCWHFSNNDFSSQRLMDSNLKEIRCLFLDYRWHEIWTDFYVNVVAWLSSSLDRRQIKLYIVFLTCPEHMWRGSTPS